MGGGRAPGPGAHWLQGLGALGSRASRQGVRTRGLDTHGRLGGSTLTSCVLTVDPAWPPSAPQASRGPCDARGCPFPARQARPTRR